jgi:hypothetical protein
MPSDSRHAGTRRPLAGLLAFVRRHKLSTLLIVFAMVASATAGLLSVGSWPTHVLMQGTRGATDIQVDSHGNLHVVFATGQLYYATNARGGWSVSLLDAVHEVWDAALALDRQDNIHVVYSAVVRVDGTASPQAVRYIALDGGAPVSELVDAHGSYPAIAVDSAGVVHVTYSVLGTYDSKLMYAKRIAGSWTNETAVPASADSAIYSAVAVDSKGVVHATYTRSPQRVGYATNEAGAWTAGWLIQDGISNRRVPIAVDDQDRVHIAYSGCSDGCDPARIVHSVRALGSWTREVVAPRSVTGDLYSFLDLAVDSTGVPHILFNDREAGTLSYLARVGNVSHLSIVDRATDGTIGGSIAIGPGGRIAIAFSHLDYSGSSVRIATYGVDGQNFLDFLWGILPFLLVEGGLFLIAGYFVWRRSRLTARKGATTRS